MRHCASPTSDKRTVTLSPGDPEGYSGEFGLALSTHSNILRCLHNEVRFRGVHIVPYPQVANGEIPLDEVPYMQRGGAWDDSDLSRKRGANVSKKVVTKKWSAADKEYAEVSERQSPAAESRLPISLLGVVSSPTNAVSIARPSAPETDETDEGEPIQVRREATAVRSPRMICIIPTFGLELLENWQQESLPNYLGASNTRLGTTLSRLMLRSRVESGEFLHNMGGLAGDMIPSSCTFSCRRVHSWYEMRRCRSLGQVGHTLSAYSTSMNSDSVGLQNEERRVVSIPPAQRSRILLHQVLLKMPSISVHEVCHLVD